MSSRRTSILIPQPPAVGVLWLPHSGRRGGQFAAQWLWRPRPGQSGDPRFGSAERSLQPGRRRLDRRRRVHRCRRLERRAAGDERRGAGSALERSRLGDVSPERHLRQGQGKPPAGGRVSRISQRPAFADARRGRPRRRSDAGSPARTFCIILAGSGALVLTGVLTQAPGARALGGKAPVAKGMRRGTRGTD